MKIKAPVFGMDRLKLTFKSNRQILKLFLKCCLSLEIFCFALGNGLLLGFVLGSFSCKPEVFFIVHISPIKSHRMDDYSLHLELINYVNQKLITYYIL